MLELTGVEIDADPSFGVIKNGESSHLSIKLKNHNKKRVKVKAAPHAAGCEIEPKSQTVWLEPGEARVVDFSVMTKNVGQHTLVASVSGSDRWIVKINET